MGMLRTGSAFALVCLAAAGVGCSSEGSGTEPTTTSGTGASGGAGTGGQGTGAGGTGGSGPVGAYDCTAPTGALPQLALTEVASGLSMPIFVVAAPGDDSRLFIAEQTGQIRVLANGSVSATPFVDLSAEVQSGGEQGLLGLAFHPAYQANGRLFVFYTESGTGAQVVAELGRTPGDPDSADPASERRLLVLSDDESNHNGGMLAFGPDGMLYIGLGDGGGGGDQHGAFGNGQNLSSLWGKIARVDVDAAALPYGIPAGNVTTVPPGNPTTGPVAPEIWSYGLRNPWRFAFDPCTHDLYIGDVGQGSWEEVDFAPAGPGQGRRNYGWRSMEGTHCYDANLGCENVEGYTPPVLDYPHGAECSVTGGYVYRASAIPALRGSYLFGDYCSGAIWRTTVTGGVATPMEPLGVSSGSSLVSFGQDNLGNVYVVYLDGRVLRLDPQ